MMERYQTRYDLVVVGGGVSGAMAALAAARKGIRVLLIEKNGYLGGALTSYGVGPMMTFFSGEQQVIKGLMQELVDHLIKRGFSCGHVKDSTQYISYVTPFNAEGLKLVLDELLAESGCDVLFHTLLAQVVTEGSSISHLLVSNKDGLNSIAAELYIDASGDGDLSVWAGEDYLEGRPQDGAAQPMTMNMKYCNVDTKRLKNYIRENPAEFPVNMQFAHLLELDTPLACKGMPLSFLAAKKEGRLSIPREDILLFETDRPGEFIINTTRLPGFMATSAWSLATAEMAGRKQCYELDQYLRAHLPGFASALLAYTGPSVGVRSSRQIIGRYFLTSQDIIKARRFDSAIAHSAYPIDIHSPAGEDTITHRIDASAAAAYYSIPYEIMVPKKTRNLLVTGRCVSADFAAQAAIRVSPTAGALGHAAGLAAVLAVRGNKQTADVDVSRLRAELVRQAAFID